MPRRQPHDWGASDEAHALLAHLTDDSGRLAKSLGIKNVNGRTTGPEMFITLVKAYLRVEVHRTRTESDPAAGAPNSSAFTKSAFTLRRLVGRPAKPKVARRRKSCKSRRQQRLPKGLRRNTFTPAGNKVVRRCDAAMVEVRRATLPASPAPPRIIHSFITAAAPIHESRKTSKFI